MTIVQGRRSHLQVLTKLFALWWQMQVQASDLTVRFGGEGDGEGLRRSVDVRTAAVCFIATL